MSYSWNRLKLTDYELLALSAPFNLADGHARYSEQEYYSRILRILRKSKKPFLDQKAVEERFASSYSGISNQSLHDYSRILYCPSASLSIEILANYLRMQNFSVGLIEPVFDNLADILKRHRVPLRPLSETHLSDDPLRYLSSVDVDAYFFVIPNNPTGYLLEEPEFQAIVDYCVSNKKLLVLDFSFRFFSRDMLKWDQFKLMDASGVNYVAIEDVGKTWPTFELKVSPLIADKVTFSYLDAIYKDVFICNSPIILHLFTELFSLTKTKGLEEIRSLISVNRQNLHRAIIGSQLLPRSSIHTSVEWLKIEHLKSDVDLVNSLNRYGIRILPGNKFFWSENKNSQFVRIALMRDSEYFSKAMHHLRHALKEEGFLESLDRL